LLEGEGLVGVEHGDHHRVITQRSAAGFLLSPTLSSVGGEGERLRGDAAPLRG
jgi:hypothetical protein